MAVWRRKKEHVPIWVSKEALGPQQCRKKVERAVKNSDKDRHFFSDPSSAISDRSQIDPTGTTSPSSVLLLLCTVTCGGK